LIAKYIACNNDTIGKTKEFIALMGEGEKIELRQANASKTRKEEKCSHYIANREALQVHQGQFLIERLGNSLQGDKVQGLIIRSCPNIQPID
jgi:hypothetical protein